MIINSKHFHKISTTYLYHTLHVTGKVFETEDEPYNSRVLISFNTLVLSIADRRCMHKCIPIFAQDRDSQKIIKK